MSDVLHRLQLTPTQLESIDRHKRFANTIRTAATRVPINDEMESLKQQLKAANDRADASAAVLAHTMLRLDDQVEIRAKLELTICRLRADNLILQKTAGVNPKIANIIDVVAKHYDTTREVIVSFQRGDGATLHRHVACYIACKITGMSLPEIGRAFNRTDHTSIMYARDKIAAAIETDTILAETIDALREKIKVSA